LGDRPFEELRKTLSFSMSSGGLTTTTLSNIIAIY